MPSLRPVHLMLGALIALLLTLQWSIWFGSPDVFDAIALHRQITEQKLVNEGLKERNAALGAEVRDLKQGSEAVEERARSDLGMVKKGETFYQVIPPAKGAPAPAPGTAAGAAPATSVTVGSGEAAAPASRPPSAHRPDRRP